MLKVKLCGLTKPEDIEAVNIIKPDYIGFVFAKSPRQINRDRAARLKNMLNPDIKTVGVFVNAQKEEIISLCKDEIIDIIQLHGDEDNRYIDSLRKQVDNKIIKAVRVKSEKDIINAKKINCDYLLLDAFNKNSYGGGGKAFNWTHIPQDIGPYFLAGGLNISNIAQAVKQCRPYSVDISSGVETGGTKDSRKMYEIVQIVRNIAN